MDMNRVVVEIFHGQIQLMKDMLQRGEMIYEAFERNPGYARFKAETMRAHYDNIDAFWKLLHENELVEICKCEGCEQRGMARRWSDCQFCGGSGFKVKEEELREADEELPEEEEDSVVVDLGAEEEAQSEPVADAE